MPIDKLAHFSVRTTNLEASRDFYCEVLGFKEGYRPEFPFPGHWLYRGGDEADYGVVHLVGIDPDDPEGLKEYLGDKPLANLQGSAAIDHLAFTASNLTAMRQRLSRAGISYRERTVPSLHLHQVFLEDPSGVTIELNFAAAEALGTQASRP